MWFGTRGYETWVKAPEPGGDSSRVGYSNSLQLLNGGASLRTSQAAHREYSWTWPNVSSRAQVRPIIDFAEGVFDSIDGVNLIYFIDPMVADANVLPQNWATPAQGGSDGVPLFDDDDNLPTLVSTPANPFRYPARGAQYTSAAQNPQSLYLPIPPGYTAWVGVHGTASNSASGIIVQPVNGYSNAGAATIPPNLAVTTSQLVNFSVASGTASGIVLSPSVASGDTLTLYGVVVQVIPTGQSPGTGQFISGQGHSGCLFNGHPTESPYSAPIDQIGMSAKLTEVGSWL
jgi:hypothetical protein